MDKKSNLYPFTAFNIDLKCLNRLEFSICGVMFICSASLFLVAHDFESTQIWRIGLDQWNVAELKQVSNFKQGKHKRLINDSGPTIVLCKFYWCSFGVKTLFCCFIPVMNAILINFLVLWFWLVCVCFFYSGGCGSRNNSSGRYISRITDDSGWLYCGLLLCLCLINIFAWS